MSQPPVRLIPRLSPRENEVLQMIVLAKPVKEIAQAMGISNHTVASYLASLYAKLGVHSARELALWDRKREAAEAAELDRVA